MTLIIGTISSRLIFIDGVLLLFFEILKDALLGEMAFTPANGTEYLQFPQIWIIQDCMPDPKEFFQFLISIGQIFFPI